MKAILFDFDGTLADTAPGIVLTMKETFRTMELPEPDAEAIKQTIGLPLKECVRVLGESFGPFSDEDAERGVVIYRKHFPTFELSNITMFPDVADTLRQLTADGLRLAICTSRGYESLQRILQRHELWDSFETVVTSWDNIAPKPAPDLVLTLLERMGLNADDALVVGDTIYDIQMGASAGCKTVAVTYGNHTKAQLEAVSPTFMIDRFSEMLDIVR